MLFALSVNLLIAQNWKEIKAGSEFSMGIKEDGTLWSWGFNGNGQLGRYTDGPYEVFPIQVGSDTDWKTVSAGGFHTLAIKTDGTLWGWGYNEFGQVIDSADLSIISPVQIGSDTDWVFVEACYASSFAIKRDGTLWAWGFNGNGQLGLNDLDLRSQPAQVGTSAWKTVSAGGVTTMGIQENNTLWRWGLNITHSDTAGYDWENDMLPVQVGIDNDWSAVSLGMEFAIALKENGSLWAYGDNSNKQLGYDTVYLNDFFQIAAEHTWKHIGAGSTFSFAITENEKLYAWGNNLYGQLGLNTGMLILIPTLVPDMESEVKQISASKGMMYNNSVFGLHTLILKKDNTFCVAGANYVGQLGIGNTSTNPTTEFICNNPVGIAETHCNASLQLRVYPNPTTGQLKITNYELRENTEYVIYSIVGQVVLEGVLQNNTINVESLASGMYFLKVDGKTVRFVKE